MLRKQPAKKSVKGDVVTPEFVDAAFSGPAFFSNRVYATRMDLGARLTFMEQTDGSRTDHFRTAVYLSLPDLLALSELVTRMIDDMGIKVEVVDKDSEN